MLKGTDIFSAFDDAGRPSFSVRIDIDLVRVVAEFRFGCRRLPTSTSNDWRYRKWTKVENFTRRERFACCLQKPISLHFLTGTLLLLRRRTYIVQKRDLPFSEEREEEGWRLKAEGGKIDNAERFEGTILYLPVVGSHESWGGPVGPIAGVPDDSVENVIRRKVAGVRIFFAQEELVEECIQ